MTTYTTIPDTDVDQDSPVTVPLMTALRDNPTAVTEGASGAPRIDGKALGTHIADVSFTTTAGECLLVDGHELIQLKGYADFSGAGALQISFTANGGSSWNSWQGVNSQVSGVGKVAFDMEINLNNGGFLGFFWEAASGVEVNISSLTIPSNPDGVRLRFSLGGTTSMARIRGLGEVA